MIKLINFTNLVIVYLISTSIVLAQKSVKEYTEKTDRGKIKKSIIMGPGFEAVTAGGFKDGHGKNPVLTSTSQIPDTVALISLYIFDLGTTSSSQAGNWLHTTYQFVSEAGGNALANEIYSVSIAQLKEAYKKQGVVLLTPEEYLNTPEKRSFYYDEFTPKVSKLGKFISGIENKHVDIAIGADYFRTLDISAAPDHLRSESIGGELVKKLGVKGALSIAIEIHSGGKKINMHGIKMSLHGPNPIPKEDKKYVAQKMGNGYYEGQLYAYGYMYFKKPIQVAAFEKKLLTNQNFEGTGIILECFVERFQESMTSAIEKAAKKYNK